LLYFCAVCTRVLCFKRSPLVRGEYDSNMMFSSSQNFTNAFRVLNGENYIL
jgi:hypothetical protein